MIICVVRQPHCGNHTVATSICIEPRKDFPKKWVAHFSSRTIIIQLKKRKSTWIKFFMLTEKTKYDKENCLHVIAQNNEPRSLRLAPD